MKPLNTLCVVFLGLLVNSVSASDVAYKDQEEVYGDARWLVNITHNLIPVNASILLAGLVGLAILAGGALLAYWLFIEYFNGYGHSGSGYGYGYGGGYDSHSHYAR